MLAISTTVATLTEMVNVKKVWIYDKEERLLGLAKLLTIVLSDWDAETRCMVKKLRQARDDQASTS